VRGAAKKNKKRTRVAQKNLKTETDKKWSMRAKERDMGAFTFLKNL